MDPSRPPTREEDLREPDTHRAGGATYVIERPAEDGLPEIIRILDDDEDLPIYSSSGEGEVSEDKLGVEDNGKVEVGDVGQGEDIPFPVSDDEDKPPVQQVEHPEDVLPASPTCEDSTSPTSSLSSSTKRSREESSTGQVSLKRQRKSCDERQEEPRPSTSDLSSSTMRCREEGDTGQVSMKRQRVTFEDSEEDPRRFTSGPSSLTMRRREESDTRQRKAPDERQEDPRASASGPSSFTMRRREGSDTRQREAPDERQEEPRPSTSGLSFSRHLSGVGDHGHSAPSTSGPSSSTMRRREESNRVWVSLKRQRKSCDERQEEQRPSTSGLGSSTQRSGEGEHRDSPPSTSGPSSPTARRYWRDDSDSDED